MQTTLPLLTLAGPAALLLAYGESRVDHGLHPTAAKLTATLASLISLAAGVAACAGLVLHDAQPWVAGQGILQVLSVRLDMVSATMLHGVCLQLPRPRAEPQLRGLEGYRPLL